LILGGVIIEGIAGEVSPASVILQGAEANEVGAAAVVVFAFLSEGRYLDGLAVQAHEHNAELGAHKVAIRKPGGEVVGVGGGSDVQIFSGEPYCLELEEGLR